MSYFRHEVIQFAHLVWVGVSDFWQTSDFVSGHILWFSLNTKEIHFFGEWSIQKETTRLQMVENLSPREVKFSVYLLPLEMEQFADPSPIPAAVHLSDSWQPGYQTLGKIYLRSLGEDKNYFSTLPKPVPKLKQFNFCFLTSFIKLSTNIEVRNTDELWSEILITLQGNRWNFEILQTFQVWSRAIQWRIQYFPEGGCQFLRDYLIIFFPHKLHEDEDWQGACAFAPPRSASAIQIW